MPTKQKQIFKLTWYKLIIMKHWRRNLSRATHCCNCIYAKLDIDVPAISEVHLLIQGILKYHEAGYIIYSPDKPQPECRLFILGFIVKRDKTLSFS